MNTMLCTVRTFIICFLVAAVGSTAYPFSVDTVKETITVSFPTRRNYPSDHWRPIILTKCFPGLHKDAAPCRKNANLIYAEELIYPDFRIRLPRFVHTKHKEIFLNVINYYQDVWRRGRVIEDYGYFLNQRGQNLVYVNVSYVGKPAGGQWGFDSCVAYGSSKHVDSFPPWSGDESAPAAIFVASPDDYSFQHFLDRVAIMLAQTRHLAKPGDWKYITSFKTPIATVRQLWFMLIPGFDEKQRLSALYGLRTRLFVYPCQTPLIHPYTQQLSSELLYLSAGLDPDMVIPVQSRSVVLFMERHGSRQWANEAECKNRIEELIVDRDRGETLLTFNAADYPSLTDIVQLGNRVKLVVGVHGGALNNIALLQPGTGIIEICPVSADHKTSRCGLMFWETGSTRHMPYWSIIADKTSPHWEILDLDCGLVLAAVKEALEGLGTTIQSPLETFHQGNSFGR